MKNIKIATNPENKTQTILFGGDFCDELGVDQLVGHRLFLTAHIPMMKEKWALRGFTVESVNVKSEKTCGLSKLAPTNH